MFVLFICRTNKRNIFSKKITKTLLKRLGQKIFKAVIDKKLVLYYRKRINFIYKANNSYTETNLSKFFLFYNK